MFYTHKYAVQLKLEKKRERERNKWLAWNFGASENWIISPTKCIHIAELGASIGFVQIVQPNVSVFVPYFDCMA